ERIGLSNLSGLTVSQAEDYAERNSLKLNTTEEYSNSVEKGVIISQSPSANTEITEGSTVSIVVSKGPKEQPPKSHNVTFTVPFKPKESEDGEQETEQNIQIYVEDMNNSLSDVFHEDDIQGDQEYTLTLVISPDETAEYKVIRDGEVIIHRTVEYK